mmetsp:Transcript_11483/g.17211  ORF Transcript_11483/g.17211 Transcript_11483/m.17211 type:complete len:226 (-) Transcript_11483:319-996(-)
MPNLILIKPKVLLYVKFHVLVVNKPIQSHCLLHLMTGFLSGVTLVLVRALAIAAFTDQLLLLVMLHWVMLSPILRKNHLPPIIVVFAKTAVFKLIFPTKKMVLLCGVIDALEQKLETSAVGQSILGTPKIPFLDCVVTILKLLKVMKKAHSNSNKIVTFFYVIPSTPLIIDQNYHHVNLLIFDHHSNPHHSHLVQLLPLHRLHLLLLLLHHHRRRRRRLPKIQII